MSRSLTALALSATLLACSTRGQRPGADDVRTHRASPTPLVDGDLTRLRAQADSAQAQGIVDLFASEVSKARGTPLAPTPAVDVRNTPQLIFFQSTPNRIVVPQWSSLPPEMREVFRTFAGGTPADAEFFFRTVFQRFLVAHEASHWFQARANRREATLYANEDAANRLAVAFYRTLPDGEEFLAGVERLVTRAAEVLPDPTPAREDPVVYFGANYQTLGADPLKYGYYQFRFMRDAVRARGTLEFAKMVAAGSR